MTGLEEDPDFAEWAQHVTDVLVPKLRDCHLTVSLCPVDPDRMDVQFAVELGMSIMLDKPIIAVIPHGMKVPDHLIRVADALVEEPAGGPESPVYMTRLTEAIKQVLGEEEPTGA